MNQGLTAYVRCVAGAAVGLVDLKKLREPQTQAPARLETNVMEIPPVYAAGPRIGGCKYLKMSETAD